MDMLFSLGFSACRVTTSLVAIATPSSPLFMAVVTRKIVTDLTDRE